jgi:para-aminobenzoate synthetase component 1
MRKIDISPQTFVPNLLSSSREIGLCLLDSCGTRHSGSNLLIAGLFPVETVELSDEDPAEVLDRLDDVLTNDEAAIFSLSYDFGRKLHSVGSVDDLYRLIEPDLFVSIYDVLLVHDYSSGGTFLTGNSTRFDAIGRLIARTPVDVSGEQPVVNSVRSNFTRSEYLDVIETIKEHIRRGNTYQTNLTQRLTADLSEGLSAAAIFHRIRQFHPAPFAAFLERKDSIVISASPERFFKIDGRRISASPIKGTRPRGRDRNDDDRLRNELLQCEKDRAENTMIVDLLRNDLGRVCEYGSVKVNELCTLQELPTLFHLVSTIEAALRPEVKPSQIIEALFPCGSITGAPKLRTMQLIDEIEKTPRGLSMGAIGVYIPDTGFVIPGMLDLNVAIRTMVIRDGQATFNVGGGIVIDSEPQNEYEESLVKARSLLGALGLSDPVKIMG